MNRYDIQVRGETVHIEFRRVNDSRRIAGTNKKPNLFGIRSAMSSHKVANQPVRHISTASHGCNVFTNAASHAPVPDAGNTITGWLVLNTRFRLASTFSPRIPKSGPR